MIELFEAASSAPVRFAALDSGWANAHAENLKCHRRKELNDNRL